MQRLDESCRRMEKRGSTMGPDAMAEWVSDTLQAEVLPGSVIQTLRPAPRRRPSRFAVAVSSAASLAGGSLLRFGAGVAAGGDRRPGRTEPAAASGRRATGRRTR
jgi:hypothetical protein